MSKTGKRKPAVCRYFADGGTCPYADKCQYLHQGPGRGFSNMGAPGVFSGAPRGPPHRPGSFAMGMPPPRMSGGRDRKGQQPAPFGMDNRGGPHFQQPYMQNHTSDLITQMNKLQLLNVPGSAPKSNDIHRMRNDIHRAQNPYSGGGGGFSSAPAQPIHHHPSSAANRNPPGQKRGSRTAKLRAPTAHPPNSQGEPLGGTMYFMPSNHQLEHMSEFSFYSSPPSHLVQARGTQIQTLYPNPEISEDLTKSNLLSLAQLPQDSTLVPAEVDHYHSLFPLESIDHTPPDQQGQRTFGYASTCYKAVDARDGLVYVLRRIHGYKLSSTKAVNEAAKWKKVRHPNVVALREMFTTKNFGDNSLVFVYDYHAGAETLLAHHFSSELGEGLHGPPVPVTESMLWQYMGQLTSALQAIHSAGLAARFVDVSKILVARNNRIRLNSVAIMDILHFDGTPPTEGHMTHYQKEDLLCTAHLLVCLASGSLAVPDTEEYTKAMSAIVGKYSEDMFALIQYLLQAGQMPHSVSGVWRFVAPKLPAVVDTMLLHQDRMENELLRELENGRLFRLLSKLGVINERPEFNQDPNWSETGDRYLLKLFRDYLFHQNTSEGSPWVDLSHIVQSLNKLDAGTQERICLNSRDGNTVLIVTYADLRQCLEAAFSEVVTASEQFPTVGKDQSSNTYH